MIEELLVFLKDAGDRLETIKNAHQSLDVKFKDEHSVSIVTKADIEISRLFKKFAADKLKNIDYFIIDEETCGIYGDKIFEEALPHEYQLVIDPLDGTMHYANDIPLFGISIGVLKNGRPEMGFLYSPPLGEVLYCDGRQVCWIKNAFKDNEEKIVLTAKKETASKQVINLQFAAKLDLSQNERDYMIVDYFCSVFCYLMLCTGRIAGGFFKGWLWDMAAGWAIGRCLGIKFYNIYSRTELECFSAQSFDNDLMIKEPFIAAIDNNLAVLKKMAIKESNNG